MDWNMAQPNSFSKQCNPSQPSIEQIYDLTTDELKQLLNRFENLSKHVKMTSHQQQLFEVIEIQLEERKTIDFFTQMMAIDNPYLNKFDQFKNQFVKLAGEAIHMQEKAKERQLQKSRLLQNTKQKVLQNDNIRNYKLQSAEKAKSRNSFKEKQIEQQLKLPKIQTKSPFGSSRLSSNTNKSNKSQSINKSSRNQQAKTPSSTQQNLNNNASITTTTLSETDGDSVSTFSCDKKMGIGKKKKNIRNIIQQTLLKSRGQQYVVGGKVSNKNLSPNQNLVTNIKNNSKAFKSPPKKQQMQKGLKAVPKPNKVNVQQSKQALEKLKKMQRKNQGVKPPKAQKGFSSKKLIQMVKKQEQQKRLKKLKQQEEKMNPNINEVLQKAQQNVHIKKLLKQQYIAQEIEAKQKSSQGSKKSEQGQNSPIFQQIQNSQEKDKQNISKQSINKNSKIDYIEPQGGRSQLMKENMECISQTAKQTLNNADSQIEVIQEQALQDSTGQKSISPKKQKASPLYTLDNELPKQALKVPTLRQEQKVYARKQTSQQFKGLEKQNQLMKNIQYIQNEFQRINSNKNLEQKYQNNNQQNNSQIELQKQSKSYNQINETSVNHLKKISHTEGFKCTPLVFDKAQPELKIEQHKKYYNQEYWAHVKQQAEHKIQLFKQQKQIQQRQKQRLLLRSQQNLNKNSQILSNQQYVSKDSPNKSQQKSFQETINDNTAKNSTQIEMENTKTNMNSTLQKMKAKFSMKTTKKSLVKAVPQIKRPLKPKPQFNYLQIFPSFNHIFSVMYTKASGQAILDIPLIMKQLSSLFSAHQQKLGKSNFFQPSMFLPFDCPNGMVGGMAGCDPKNLLMHTQNTYVDLKKMVERLQIFDKNIHGQFDSMKGGSCTEGRIEANNMRYYRVIKTKQQVYDIITTSFLRTTGWKQLPKGCSLKTSWNLFWSWGKPQLDMNKLLTIQRINHFPFNKNLSRKDLLHKNLDSFRKNYRVSMPFLPLTYVLPKQFSLFTAKFHQQTMLSPHNYWIMKPIGKSRGRGIKVISNLGQLNYIDNIVVQKYITNPLLIEGYKFDMRVYALVTSFHPLQAFIYKEGFARFSTEKFSLQPSSIKNTFIHLTNFSINRHNCDAKVDQEQQNGKKQKSGLQFKSGSKISFKMLKDRLTKMGYSYSTIWTQIHQIIIKSLLACSVHVPKFPSAFQLFGYDVMVDDGGSCHLIEINTSPSLERAYMLDQVVKQALIDDIIDIVDPPAFDKEQFLNIAAQRAAKPLINMNKKNPSNQAEQEDLIDLARIFKYKPLRKFGETPAKRGLFQMIAPCTLSNDLQKMIKSKSGANNMHNID